MYFHSHLFTKQAYNVCKFLKIFHTFLIKHANKNDYRSMRIISDEDFNVMLKVLLQNEQVALFQNLLLSKKTEPTDENKGTEWTTTE